MDNRIRTGLYGWIATLLTCVAIGLLCCVADCDPIRPERHHAGFTAVQGAAGGAVVGLLLAWFIAGLLYCATDKKHEWK
jgi:hypothetical protein